MFEYIIENNEVTITGIIDKSVDSIIIPEFINGYKVVNINFYYKPLNLNHIIIPKSIDFIHINTFPYGLKSINGASTNNGIYVINDKFIYDGMFIYIITSIIDETYSVTANDCQLYFINNERYYVHFKKTIF